MKITCKFGGSSLADADCYERARDILAADKNRKFAVVSAPGKRFDGDVKITDLLYKTYEDVKTLHKTGDSFYKIRDRFYKIAVRFGKEREMNALLDETESEILKNQSSRDFAVSRGEFLSATIFSWVTGFNFIDPTAFLVVDGDEISPFEVDAGGVLKNNFYSSGFLDIPEYSVVAGFYGKDRYGRIKLLSRGGGDVTGALVAFITRSDRYENFTDVDGICAADPKIIKNPKRIDYISLKEAEVLFGSGTGVFNKYALKPLAFTNTEVVIKNTFRESVNLADNSAEKPIEKSDKEKSVGGGYERSNYASLRGGKENKGTVIGPSSARWKCYEKNDSGGVIAISGENGYALIRIERFDLKSDTATFAAKLLTEYGYKICIAEEEQNGITFFVQNKNAVLGALTEINAELSKRYGRAAMSTRDNLSLITAVLREENDKTNVGAAELGSAALNKENIPIVLGYADNSKLCFAVNSSDYKKAVRVLYDVFILKSYQ